MTVYLAKIPSCEKVYKSKEKAIAFVKNDIVTRGQDFINEIESKRKINIDKFFDNYLNKDFLYLNFVNENNFLLEWQILEYEVEE